MFLCAAVLDLWKVFTTRHRLSYRVPRRWYGRTLWTRPAACDGVWCPFALPHLGDVEDEGLVGGSVWSDVSQSLRFLEGGRAAEYRAASESIGVARCAMGIRVNSCPHCVVRVLGGDFRQTLPLASDGAQRASFYV